MPRNGGGVMSWPANGDAVPNETIESASYNARFADLLADLNAARPISAGGTSATTAAAAFTALKQAATTSATGVVELATNAETITGTDTARATTPAGVKAAIDELRAGNFSTSIQITSTDASADINPLFYGYRNSASPAANDWMLTFKFDGNDSGGNRTTYAQHFGYIVDPTNGSEDGGVQWHTQVAGTLDVRLSLAQGLFMAGATGGDPGVGKINATGYQINGVAFGPADYGAGNAALSVGAVGTYAFLRQQTGAARSPGYTTAGSNLRYSDTQDGNNGTTPSGTWRLMGENVNANSANLWLRIS